MAGKAPDAVRARRSSPTAADALYPGGGNLSGGLDVDTNRALLPLEVGHQLGRHGFQAIVPPTTISPPPEWESGLSAEWNTLQCAVSIL